MSLSLFIRKETITTTYRTTSCTQSLHACIHTELNKHTCIPTFIHACRQQTDRQNCVHTSYIHIFNTYMQTCDICTPRHVASCNHLRSLRICKDQPISGPHNLKPTPGTKHRNQRTRSRSHDHGRARVRVDFAEDFAQSLHLRLFRRASCTLHNAAECKHCKRTHRTTQLFELENRSKTLRLLLLQQDRVPCKQYGAIRLFKSTAVVQIPIHDAATKSHNHKSNNTNSHLLLCDFWAPRAFASAAWSRCPSVHKPGCCNRAET